MSEIKSLARGLKILEQLADSPDGLGITELAATYEVDKATMSRLMQTLANYDYAVKDESSRKYVLGTKVFQLSQALLSRMTVTEIAKPFLNQLVDQTGECAHIAILAQGQALYIDQAESPSTLRVTTGVGTLAPLHCTALGKVLLSFTDAPLPTEMRQYTARTITDPALIQRHLEIVKEQGYAVDDEEYNIGVRCVAVPVYDYRDHCIAAFGVSGPTSRISLEKVTELSRIVLDTGNALSTELSFKTERNSL